MQDYPSGEDNHWNDEPARSLHCACDLVPFAARCDVALVGDAFAPNGQPVRSLTVRMVIGAVDKCFEVFGDRYRSQQGELVEAACG